MQITEYMCVNCGGLFLEQEWIRETKRDEEYIEGTLPYLDAVINDMKKGLYIYSLKCPGCKRGIFASRVPKIRR